MDNLAEYIQGMLHEDLIGRTPPQEVDINESYFIMWLDTEAMEDKIKKKKVFLPYFKPYITCNFNSSGSWWFL